jgi:hypothetical protein
VQKHKASTGWRSNSVSCATCTYTRPGRVVDCLPRNQAVTRRSRTMRLGKDSDDLLGWLEQPTLLKRGGRIQCDYNNPGVRRE